MASFLYDSFWTGLFHGTINPASDTFYMMLTTSTYTPSKSAHTKRSDVTNEITGTGYVAGGAACTVTTTDAASNSDKQTLEQADVSWTSSTLTARYGVVYKHRGGASSADELVSLNDFGGDITDTAGTFTAHQTAPFGVQN